MCRCTKKYLELVHELLADRLPLSRSWNNVSVVLDDKKKTYEVIWHDSKTMNDPEGKKTFSSHGGEYTMDGLHKEIKDQKKKLKEDRRGG